MPCGGEPLATLGIFPALQRQQLRLEIGFGIDVLAGVVSTVSLADQQCAVADAGPRLRQRSGSSSGDDSHIARNYSILAQVGQREPQRAVERRQTFDDIRPAAGHSSIGKPLETGLGVAAAAHGDAWRGIGRTCRLATVQMRPARQAHAPFDVRRAHPAIGRTDRPLDIAADERPLAIKHAVARLPQPNTLRFALSASGTDRKGLAGQRGGRLRVERRGAHEHCCDACQNCANPTIEHVSSPPT